MNRLPILLAFATAALAAGEERRTDALFAEFAKPGSPGCAVGVMRDGRTLLAKGYGLGDLEQGVPLSPRSVFYLASVSKQFMAFSVLLLEQQGKLSLDDPVGKHVAGLPAHTARITLRQLLHHTGGVRDYLALGFLAGFPRDHVWTERAALNSIARQKATNFEPGAEHLYSNSGYVLLSLAAQRVIGGKLNDWMRRTCTRLSA
jgi:CubicO group peptidase (beta-lactamase class C family)